MFYIPFIASSGRVAGWNIAGSCQVRFQIRRVRIGLGVTSNGIWFGSGTIGPMQDSSSNLPLFTRNTQRMYNHYYHHHQQQQN